MKNMVIVSLLVSMPALFCADEIARRIREEWDRLEYALPGGNYSDTHRFHERIAAFMGEACYGKLQRQSHVFGETVDGTYDLMRDELRINFNGLASALKKF